MVPSRDSRTGVVTEQFRDVFEARRRRTLSAEVDATGWSHAYRLAVNTAAAVLEVVMQADNLRVNGCE